MRSGMRWLSGALILIVALSTPAAGAAGSEVSAADKSAIQQMAVIMHRLKHFPSPQGKSTLKQIVDNPAASSREKDLATAIMNLNHRALLDDKVKLKKIMEDEGATADEKALASIVYNLDHRPTKADKKCLQEMVQ